MGLKIFNDVSRNNSELSTSVIKLKKVKLLMLALLTSLSKENEKIKAGQTPKRIENNSHIKSQKYLDARWIKKNDEKHFDYKNHVTIENQNKFIRHFKVTSAEVHESRVFLDIFD